MNWKKELFQSFKLYAVTDLRTKAESEIAKIEAVLDGGVDVLQLRSKYLSEGDLLEVGERLRRACEKQHTLFFVNDRADIALALGADGLHLGQDDMPVAKAREMAAGCRQELWIGKSTHAAEQLQAAENEAPDYVGVGPVYSTPTKPGYAPAGLDYVRLASREAKMPFVAIGGIHLDNVEEVVRAGARRIAVVRAIFDAPDPARAARQIRSRIEGVYV